MSVGFSRMAAISPTADALLGDGNHRSFVAAVIHFRQCRPASLDCRLSILPANGPGHELDVGDCPKRTAGTRRGVSTF